MYEQDYMYLGVEVNGKAEVKPKQKDRISPPLSDGGNDNRHGGHVMPFASICYVIMKSWVIEVPDFIHDPGFGSQPRRRSLVL